MKKLLLLFTLLALIHCSGCAGFSSYIKDRALDFADCFTLEAGWGLIADAELRATDWISTGAGLAIGMKWGLDGRNPVGVGLASEDVEGVDMHAGLLFPDWNIRQGSHIMATLSPDAPLGTPSSWVQCKESHKSILLLDMTAFPEYRDKEICEEIDEYGHHYVRRARKLIDAFDVEAGASLGLSVRAGFSPGQFLDFLLGWTGIDIAGDDNIKQKKSLIRAVEKGLRDEVEKLIAEGADVNGCAYGTRPLHTALDCKGREGIAKFLLDKGARVNARDNSGNSSLHHAVWSPELSKLLVSKGASANAKNTYGQTPLHEASRCGHKEVIELLITQGANMNVKDYRGLSPLYLAANAGEKEAVEMLIAKDADVNARDIYGWAPLHEAARLGFTEIVKILVENGADVNARDNESQTTPLHFAMWGEHKEIVEFLTARGADSNAEK